MSVGRRLLVRARGICALVPVDLMRKVIRFLALTHPIITKLYDNALSCKKSERKKKLGA